MVDEYDAPIISKIKEPERLQKAIITVRDLFSSVKALDGIIELSFFTGITNIGKDSYFSTLNHLLNLTDHYRYATICGYTHADTDTHLKDHVVALATRMALNVENTKAQLFKWYKGYSWDGENFVLIPFSVLSAFDRLSIDSVWAQSASMPSVFLDFIKKSNFNLQELIPREEMETSSSIFHEVNIERVSIDTFMLQTGFLTVKKRSTNGLLIVGYPNLEVKQAVNAAIGSEIFGNPSDLVITNRATEIAAIINNLHTSRDISPLQTILAALFANIPHQLLQHKRESLYHSALYTICYLASLQVDADVSTSNGRTDVIIQTASSCIILECKYEKSAEIAVKQVFDKKYYAPFLADGKQIITIECNFTDDGLTMAAEYV